MKKIKLDIKIPVWFSTEIEVEDDEVVDFVWTEKKLSEEFTEQNRMVAIKPETLSDIIDNFEFSDDNIDENWCSSDNEPLEYWLKIGDNDPGRPFYPEEMNDMLLKTETFDKLKKLETALNRDKQIDDIIK